MTAPDRSARALVVGALLAAVVAVVAVTASGCTDSGGAGVRAERSTLPTEVLGPFLPVVTADGLSVLGANAVVRCDPGADAGDECRVVGSAVVPGPVGGRVDLLATADTDGTGIATLAVGEVGDGDERTDGVLLVTCTAETCRDDTAPAAVVAGGDPVPDARLSAIAAGDAGYALVIGRGPDVQLVLCADATCADPQAVPLGAATVHDIVRAQFAPDGTVWIAQSDVAGSELRVTSLAPGAATPSSVLALDLPDAEGGAWPNPYLNQVLRLVVRDDGSPVVLYRDPSDDALVLVSCDDASCAAPTTNRLDVDPAQAEAADLAVDRTGRPLVATSGAGGLRLHGCTDVPCTGLESRTVSSGTPLTGPDGPFLLVDGDRPVVLVTEKVSDGPDRAVVLRCEEARCGL